MREKHGMSRGDDREGQDRTQARKLEVEEDDTLRSFPIVLPKLIKPSVKNGAPFSRGIGLLRSVP